ncbi:hypothetical protein DICA3_B13960 [Diutina catenulata]
MIGVLLKVAKTLAQVGFSLGMIALVGLYTYQSKLIYPASLNDGHGYCATPDEYEMDNYELVYLRTEDGETLQCYSILHDSQSENYTNKTVVILCPNAGNIGHALPIVQLFYKTFGYNVFIYSYRGYGKSSGSASEAGLKMDAKRVMEYLTVENQQIAASSLVLYGRSLGGAVAIYIASTWASHISGIILENTFLSLRKTVPHIFPFLKYFVRLVHDKWESEALVTQIPENVPVLMQSARRDEIVPPQHMDTLFALIPSKDKTFFEYTESNHNDTVAQEYYWERVHEFIKNKVNPVGY